MKTLNSWKLLPAFAAAILLGGLGTLPVVAQNYPTVLATYDPLVWWQFDDAGTSPPPLTTTNATALTAVGYAVGDVTNGEPGIVGSCVEFDNPGAATGYGHSKIDVPWQAAFNPNPPFSVEFWAKPRGVVTDVAPVTGVSPLSSMDQYDVFEADRSGYIFYYDTAVGWVFRIGGQDSYAAVAGPSTNLMNPPGQWTYIVGEFDGTNASLYINGALASTAASVPGGFQPNFSFQFRIGASPFYGNTGISGYLPGPGNRGWDGWVDEVAVYATLLTSNQVSAHFAAVTTNNAGYHTQILADNPTAYFPFEEPTYTAPSPSSFPVSIDSGSLGAADNGTNTLGSLIDQPGIPLAGFEAANHSAWYDGETGSLVLATNDPALDNFFSSAQPVSYVAWINPTDLSGFRTILEQGYDTGTGFENYFRICDTWDWEGLGEPFVPYYEVGCFDGAYEHATFPVPPGDVGNWVFLVGTWDGTEWSLYRDGNLIDQVTNGAGPIAVPNTPPWSVGSISNPGDEGWYFRGSLKDVAIIPSALAPSDVAALYLAAEMPPVITEAPVVTNSPLYDGSSVGLSVWADGSPTLTYQWEYNGAPLAGQNATNLLLPNLTSSQSGTYAVVVSNTWGSVTSSVVVSVLDSVPVFTQSPAAETRWSGFPFAFSFSTVGNTPQSYQWQLGGNNIGGATGTSYTNIASPSTGGFYTVVASNTFGAVTSAPVALTVLTTTNNYIDTILADGPAAYYRLDETNGDTAHDYVGGNDGTYFDVTLGVPGYSAIDPDTAIAVSGQPGSYVGNISPAKLEFGGLTSTFTLEAWASGPANQPNLSAALIAKGTDNVGNGGIANEEFVLGLNGGDYAFLVRDPANTAANGTQITASVGPDGNWHHIVGVCDEVGGALSLYVDGQLVASGSPPATGVRSSTFPISIGGQRSGNDPVYDWIFQGSVDEVAIYPTALSSAQVLAHFVAQYGTNTPPTIVTAPVSVTNYVSLPVTLSAFAYGSYPVTYQWNKVGSGPIAGATANSFSIPNLAATDAGVYTLGITNPVTGILTAPVTITVLQPPTNPPAIAGLVMHLTFDDTLVDATGRGNNATNEASGGAPLITNNYTPGVIGDAFMYQTTVDTNAGSSTTNANYASVGVRPDLQFGTNSFTVSMWVQTPGNYTGADLPFFCDVVGSTFGAPGFCFEPSFSAASTYAANTWPGGWGFSVLDATGNGAGVFGNIGTINDGNFHNLVYVIDRANGAVVYLDGVAAHQNLQVGNSVVGIGSINSAFGATIGQDPTGVYGQASDGNFAIDDLGVWTRALAPLEVASIYIAGKSNQVSFVGTPTAPTLSLQTLPGSTLQLTWSAGTLQATTNLSGTWTNVVGATSPYTNSPTLNQQFFRVEE